MKIKTVLSPKGLRLLKKNFEDFTPVELLKCFNHYHIFAYFQDGVMTITDLAIEMRNTFDLHRHGIRVNDLTRFLRDNYYELK